MTLTQEAVRAFGQSLGLTTIGMIPCRKWEELRPFYSRRKEEGLENEFEASEIDRRIDPFYYLPEGKTIISIAFPYDDQEAHVPNGFSIYTKRRDYHQVVKSYLDLMIAWIEQQGGRAIGLVDSHTLPERYMAYLAGIGFIGRNQMLITPEYGSYVFLGEIITDLEIPCDEQGSLERLIQYEPCGDCTRCLRSCPTKAIHEKGCSPNQCLSYLTQKKHLAKEEIQHLKGNVFGCDYCQLGCPYNQKAKKTSLAPFATLDYMNEPQEVYAAMDNAYFKAFISQTSCGWRGKNVIRRNAILALSHKGKEVKHYKGDSPYINSYIEE